MTSVLQSSTVPCNQRRTLAPQIRDLTARLEQRNEEHTALLVEHGKVQQRSVDRSELQQGAVARPAKPLEVDSDDVIFTYVHLPLPCPSTCGRTVETKKILTMLGAASPPPSQVQEQFAQEARRCRDQEAEIAVASPWER